MYVATDYLTSSAAWFTFNIVRYYTLDSTASFSSLKSYMMLSVVIWGQILFPVMLMMIYWLSGYYNNVFSKSRIDSVGAAFTSTIIGTIFIYFIAIFNDVIPDRLGNFILVLILEGLLFAWVAAGRLIISSILLRLRSMRRIWRNAAVIGTRDSITECTKIFNDTHPAIGLRVVKSVTAEDLTPETDFDDVDVFIIALPESESREQMNVLRILYRHKKQIFRADWYERQSWPSRSRITNVAGAPLTDISSVVISEGTRNFKRVADIVVSFLALIVLSPVLVAIAIAVKITDGGPVIFSQERVGRHGNKFNIYKFRTMVTDAETQGPELSRSDDSRVTPPGRFLRKYRLDELPQFWNVIKGEMSLVGPRPEREFYEEQIIARAPEYTLLHQLRPGITSWGMVKYGYASDVDSMVRRMRYDIIYLENVSILIDIKILFYTVNTVFTGKGV